MTTTIPFYFPQQTLPAQSHSIRTDPYLYLKVSISTLLEEETLLKIFFFSSPQYSQYVFDSFSLTAWPKAGLSITYASTSGGSYIISMLSQRGSQESIPKKSDRYANVKLFAALLILSVLLLLLLDTDRLQFVTQSL